MSTGEDRRRHQVTSADGTTIGWDSGGSGPPLLLVHGGIGDRTRWSALRPLLEPHLTVHAMDRRGRGLSGDHPDDAVAREEEDVAAVAEAITDRAGERVAVYGHSYGGLCTYGAALRTGAIGRLILYEGWPPVDPAAWVPSDELMARLHDHLGAGDREGLLVTFLRDAVQMDDEQISAYRVQPSWSGRVAAAHTILREEPAFAGVPFDPATAARITVPTLLLVGEVQPLDWQVETVAAALPDARIEVLAGQEHGADITAPELVAERLLAFLQVASTADAPGAGGRDR